MEIFYSPTFSESNPVLDEQESSHCIQVLRHRVGDAVDVTDGKGHHFKGSITEAHHKRCRIAVDSVQQVADVFPFLHIAVAPTKNMDRIEWFAEKATEIGVNAISLLLCRHSERKNIRADRVDKVVVSAMKQSQKFFKPQVNDLLDFKKFVTQPFDGLKLIAHCHEGEKQPLKTIYQSGQNALILIGPEGDFSLEEVNMALKNGFVAVSLGDSRLRTETAALVACHTVRVLN